MKSRKKDGMRGKMESFTLILIVICSLSLVCSIVSIVLGIVILNKQNEVVQETRKTRVNDMNHSLYMEQSSAMVQKNVTPQRGTKIASQGTIICRKCYSAIPEHVKECPCCQAVADRR